MTDVLALAEEHLALAKGNPHGRSTHTYVNEGLLRQALIALTAGTALGDHDAPPAASLHVLSGRVRLIDDEKSLELRTGHAAPIPQRRHSLEADEDSVVILTSVVNVPD
ncbi:quercetin dioxygenase-like cupin family protein [Streptosporangium becharense]|uniref:Quercetin dioxygenase-like cupin family protein n=1 Tax=Streptosporangium becharense TaxID=1816182 RepID=A0A7W9MJD4_9ACTN|nr:cupin [Streptosporangium becharense]MBB2910182.1 quercetin dioxygenase-like cupin family protein [Streptosporangium becharense]MBB5822925.1 quercetin dioxygenase-like cupin family protein [Streptosporangium becharense]